MRSRFDEQLSNLSKELTTMGAMCEEIIALTSKALSDGDKKLLSKVFPIANDIDRMERTIEALCLRLLLQQQPVARDLRQISAALKMITDMERIGDQTADIAEIVPFICEKPSENCALIGEMAKAAISMVTMSIDAYVKQDLDIAHAAMVKDDIVDGYFRKIKRLLIDMIAGMPEDGEYALDLLMIAKYFERIGDHAVNVAEWVAFSITGEHVEQNL